jgi:hypothetical protein
VTCHGPVPNFREPVNQLVNRFTKIQDRSEPVSRQPVNRLVNWLRAHVYKICSWMAVSFEIQHNFQFSGEVKLSDVKVCSWMAVSFDSQHFFFDELKLSDVKICSWMAVSFDSQHNLSFFLKLKLRDVKICSWMAVSFDSQHNLSFIFVFWSRCETVVSCAASKSRPWSVPKRVGRVEPAAGCSPGDTACSRVDFHTKEGSKYTSYNAGLQTFAIGIFGTHSNKQYPTRTHGIG